MADSNPLIGSIMMFAGNFAPRGYAFCAGQLMSIAQNTALFSILGTTYGGDGRVTFGLPDLRGRVPRQQGTGAGLDTVVLGEMAGTPNTTLLMSNLPPHTHSFNGNNTPSTDGAPSPAVVVSDFGDAGNPLTSYSTTAPNITLSPQSISMAGGSQPMDVRNPYLGINYIIALVGIFPSRN